MYKVKKLKNGLQYLVIPTQSETVAVSVLIKTGSAYETAPQNGVAHFLEHMMFKKTEKRGSAKDIAFDFEKIGAMNNAFTSTTLTGYWAKASKNNAANIIEILSDIYKNAQFPVTEVEKEKGVVIQEMAMYEDMYPEKVSIMLDELMYPGQAFGRSILGTKKTVSSFSQEDLRAFYDKYYVPENTLVTVSGGIKPAEIHTLLKKLFEDKKGKFKKQVLADPKIVPTQKKKEILSKTTDQVHMILGLETPGYTHKDRFVYRLIAVILGQGMSSRLFLKMREELGICYYVHAVQETSTKNKGRFILAAGVDMARSQIGLMGIWGECEQLATYGTGKAELDKAKQMIKSAIAMSLESCEELSNFYASQYLRTGELMTPKEMYKKIDAVTEKDILRIARALFKKENTYLAAIGENVDHLLL
ncbi:MAG: hypothetical protein RJB39_54 [Candidatus Parcubacteria bacterium]|jgi:predicted Zn-dependent peptidase